MTSAVRECGARCPTGLVGEYVCNRYEDHEGDHEAHYQEPSGRWILLAHWSDVGDVPIDPRERRACVRRIVAASGVVDARRRD